MHLHSNTDGLTRHCAHQKDYLRRNPELEPLERGDVYAQYRLVLVLAVEPAHEHGDDSNLQNAEDAQLDSYFDREANGSAPR